MKAKLLTASLVAATAYAQQEWINVGAAQQTINNAAGALAFVTSFILPIVLMLGWLSWLAWKLMMHRTIFEAVTNPALYAVVAYALIWFVVKIVLPNVSPALYSIYQQAVQAAGRDFFP